MRKLQLYFFLFFLNMAPAAFAQLKITIHDESNKTTLPSAHVCFESLDKQESKYCLSNMDGIVNYELQKPALMSVSYVGFEHFLDTVYPGDSRHIYLKPSSYAVEELVVTAQFSPKRIDESIYKVKVINSAAVENKGAANLSDLISNELNFSPVRDAALGTSVRIQGLGGEHVKILIDGVPVIGRQNGILDLSQINVSNIDHIEVVEGPMSVVYGSNALAGVINIITKKGNDQSLSAGVKSYVESVGTYDLDADIIVNKENHGFTFATGRYFFSGYDLTEDTRAKDWDPKLQYNLDASYSFRKNGWNIALTESLFHEQLRDLGNVTSALRYEGAFDSYHFTNRWDNKLNVSKQLQNKQSLNVSSAFSSYTKTKISYVNDLVNLEKNLNADATAHDTTRFHNVFSRGTYSNENLEKFSWLSGYEVTWETATGKRLIQEESMGELAAFLNANYTPVKSFNIQPGLRYIKNLKYDAPLSYSMNIKWDPVPQLSFRTSYAKGFRAPSIKELYLNFKDSNHNITGNPDLMAETGNNFNVWFDYRSSARKKNSFEWANNVYYNVIENKIDLLYDPQDPTYAVYFNVPVGEVITKGFSSNLTYRLHPRLTVNGGLYHNQMSSIVDTDVFTKSNDFAGNFTYKNVRYRFELSLFYKYTDHYSRYSGSVDVNTGEIMDVYVNYLDDYHNMDATLSIPFWHSKLKVTGGVKNIFNNTTLESTGSGGVHSGGGSGVSLLNYGRTYFLRLSYNFKKHFSQK